MDNIENAEDDTRYPSSHILEIFEPTDLSLFRPAAIILAVSQRDTRYLLLKIQSYWFSVTVIGAVKAVGGNLKTYEREFFRTVVLDTVISPDDINLPNAFVSTLFHIVPPKRQMVAAERLNRDTEEMTVQASYLYDTREATKNRGEPTNNGEELLNSQHKLKH
ncbi:hypothetical protein BDN70DRAFT_209410 [Pholiota conissans]|uniref:Uncharacterized protein n=1 Tax=Pholiota conissans TaxID=109636 RepID=A0A9P6CQH6_9AGAR|nr:hypothetical protein BDN70DRAFT_209410 [Pholiota conissans]